jgi:hypothetical protein
VNGTGFQAKLWTPFEFGSKGTAIITNMCNTCIRESKTPPKTPPVRFTANLDKKAGCNVFVTPSTAEVLLQNRIDLPEHKLVASYGELDATAVGTLLSIDEAVVTKMTDEVLTLKSKEQKAVQQLLIRFPGAVANEVKATIWQSSLFNRVSVGSKVCLKYWHRSAFNGAPTINTCSVSEIMKLTSKAGEAVSVAALLLEPEEDDAEILQPIKKLRVEPSPASQQTMTPIKQLRVESSPASQQTMTPIKQLRVESSPASQQTMTQRSPSAAKMYDDHDVASSNDQFDE